MKAMTEVGRRSTRGDRFVPDYSHLVLPSRLELNHPLAMTSNLKRADAGLRSILDRNQIGLIDGLPGTGKTTFAQYAAERCGRPSAIAVMPENPAPLDFLRISITAVTGHNPHGGTKTEMEAELIESLSTWQGLLIVDEVQNVRFRGLNEARYIHDITRPKFPMLLLGHRALQSVQENPTLDSRVRIRRVFKALQGAELFETVRTISTAFNDQPDDVIRYADDKWGRGNLRRWVSLVETLDDLAVQTATRFDIDMVLAEMGVAA